MRFVTQRTEKCGGRVDLNVLNPKVFGSFPCDSLSSAVIYSLLCPRLFFPGATEKVAVYQEARIKDHNILGIIPAIHSYWTVPGYLLFLNLSLFKG